jgi:hypothetical protein
MGRTWEALRRAEHERANDGETVEESASERVDEQPLSLWMEEELASIQVALHALEDRLELELGALRDELREGLAKAREQTAAPETVSSDRLRREIASLHAAAERIERRTRWTLFAVIATGLAVLLWL